MTTERRSEGGGGEYLLEFLPAGQAVKVSAIDPVSGIEVSIVGPASAGEAALGRAAVNKLKYVLRKRAGETAAAPAPRRGITV
ncbi:MAG TPA: hypothetical protein VE631_09105 [Alphaproteobacteria bacterium]|jgi:hypothetical protein|nr:hypothetical protein [Alphaproteobacteria bacterium]